MKVLRNSKFTPFIGLIVGAAIGLICFRLTSVNAGNLEPTATPGPTMKTLDQVEPRIPIPASASPSATYTISVSGSYYLTGDRNCSETGIIGEDARAETDVPPETRHASFSSNRDKSPAPATQNGWPEK